MAMALLGVAAMVAAAGGSRAEEVTVSKRMKFAEPWILDYANAASAGNFCRLNYQFGNGRVFGLTSFPKSLVMSFRSESWNLQPNDKPTLKFTFGQTNANRSFEMQRSSDKVAYVRNNDANAWRDIATQFANSGAFAIRLPDDVVLTGKGSFAAILEWQRCSSAWSGQKLDFVNDDGRAKASGTTPPKPEARDGTGTGIVLSAEGLIATNAHVAGNCKKITVRWADRTADAELVAKDQANDLAVLRVPATFATVATLSDRQIELGAKVATYGFPLYGSLSSSGNFTIGYVSGLTGIADDTRFLQISAPVQQGNSGGPLIDARGNVVGIVTSKLDAMKFATRGGDIPQNVNFAIRVQALRYFLEAHNLALKPPPAKPEKDRTDIELAAIGKAISVLVRCQRTEPKPSGG